MLGFDVFAVYEVKPVQKQIGIVEDVTLALSEDGQRVAAGGDNGRSRSAGILQALDHTVDHAGIAVDHAGAHGVHRIVAELPGRPESPA